MNLMATCVCVCVCVCVYVCTRHSNYSIEFCGGTHLESLGQAKAFSLISEEGK